MVTQYPYYFFVFSYFFFSFLYIYFSSFSLSDSGAVFCTFSPLLPFSFFFFVLASLPALLFVYRRFTCSIWGFILF